MMDEDIVRSRQYLLSNVDALKEFDQQLINVKKTNEDWHTEDFNHWKKDNTATQQQLDAYNSYARSRDEPDFDRRPAMPAQSYTSQLHQDVRNPCHPQLPAMQCYHEACDDHLQFKINS